MSLHSLLQQSQLIWPHCTNNLTIAHSRYGVIAICDAIYTDDIKTGLQPFIVMDDTEVHQANTMEVARDYGFLVDGAVGISYESLMALWDREICSLPVTYICKQYQTMLPYCALHTLAHMKIAPAGISPQCEHCPQLIINYSWNQLNQTTLKIVPDHATQFGYMHCPISSNTWFMLIPPSD